jgi:hypothetical protein
MDSIRIAGMAVVMLALGGCMSYPPALSPAKGQNAAQQTSTLASATIRSIAQAAHC